MAAGGIAIVVDYLSNHVYLSNLGELTGLAVCDFAGKAQRGIPGRGAVGGILPDVC
jgi:hypothetical protein